MLCTIEPNLIKREMFLKKQPYKTQEETRQIISKALLEMDADISNYGEPYILIIPQKTWERKKLAEFKTIAKNHGGHMANWIELALSWAYQLSFCTSWMKLCYNPDTADWFRAVIWRDKKIRLVGGSRHSINDPPPSYIHEKVYSELDVSSWCVPLIVKR